MTEKCWRCQRLEQRVRELETALEHSIYIDPAIASKFQEAFALTPTEAAVLSAFWRAKGQQTLTSIDLDTLVPAFGRQSNRNDPEFRTTNVMKVYVCRLRKKLGYGILSTVTGAGWRLTLAGRDKLATALA